MEATCFLAELEKYVQMGWAIIPIKAGGKEALVKWAQYQRIAPTLEQVLDWAERFPDCRWAVITGEVSGIMVVDCDNPTALQAAEALGITSSVSVTTPHGNHFFYRLPKDGKVRKTISGHGSKGTYWPQVAGLDLRYEGGYAILPPSDGYDWDLEESDIEDELTVYPDWPGATYEDEKPPELPQPQQPTISNFSDLDLTNTSLEGKGKTENKTEKKYKEIAEQYPDGKIPRGGSGIHDATFNYMSEEALMVGIGLELKATGQKFMEDYFSAPLTDGRFETSLNSVKVKERENHPERFDTNGNYIYHKSTKGVTSNALNTMKQVTPPANIIPTLLSDDAASYADGDDIDCWQYPMLPKASIIQVYGYSGHGKSMILEHALHHAGLGLNFGPFGGNGKARVLYLDFENGRTTWGRRVQQMKKSFGNPKEYLHYWTPWLNNETMNLCEVEGLIKLQQLILQTRPDIVVIDTLRSAFPGLKENSAEDWTPINQLSLTIRNAGCTLVLVHHSNKPGKEGLGSEAGSSNQLTTLEIQLRVTQVLEDADLAKTRGAIYAPDLPSNPFGYMRKQLPKNSTLPMVFELSYGKVREWTDLHDQRQYIGIGIRPDGRSQICHSDGPKDRLKKLIRAGNPRDMIMGKMVDKPLQTLEKWATEMGLNFPKK